MSEPNWIDKATLAVGIVSIFVAMVVLVVNNRNQARNRKIHVADKRQEWCRDFRNLLGDCINLQNQIMKGLVENLVDRQLKLQELATIHLRFRLMFMDGDSKYSKLKDSLDIIYKELNKMGPNPGFIGLEREKLLKTSNEILGEQRRKIANLDSEKPLI